MGYRIIKLNIIFVLVTLWLTNDLVNASCWSSGDGLRITCEDTFAHQRVRLVMNLKICRENPKVAVKVDVDALNIHLEKEGSELEIPIEGIGGSVIVDLTSKPNGDITISLKVKISLLPAVKVYSNTVRDDNCNGILYWIQSQSTIVLVGVGAGVLLLLISCCCCCYCCCCRRKTAPPTMVVPHVHASVPYERQHDEM